MGDWRNIGSKASSNCRVEGRCIRHVQVLYVVVVLCPAGPGTVLYCSGGTSFYELCAVVAVAVSSEGVAR